MEIRERIVEEIQERLDELKVSPEYKDVFDRLEAMKPEPTGV